MNSFICPACNRKASLKHYVNFADKQQLYFACRHEPCRNHFQVVRMSGWPDQVVAQSPQKVTPQIGALGVTAMATQMGCPSCNRYGKIKMTIRRRDGYWRRHVCTTDGVYYTCETEEGVTVHRKMKSLLAVEVA